MRVAFQRERDRQTDRHWLNNLLKITELIRSPFNSKAWLITLHGRACASGQCYNVKSLGGNHDFPVILKNWIAWPNVLVRLFDIHEVM